MLPARRECPYFLIVSEMSGLCLEVGIGMFGGVKGGQEIEQSKIDGKENQLWYEDENGQLRLKASEFAVQVEGKSRGVVIHGLSVTSHVCACICTLVHVHVRVYCIIKSNALADLQSHLISYSAMPLAENKTQI